MRDVSCCTRWLLTNCFYILQITFLHFVSKNISWIILRRKKAFYEFPPKILLNLQMVRIFPFASDWDFKFLFNLDIFSFTTLTAYLARGHGEDNSTKLSFSYFVRYKSVRIRAFFPSIVIHVLSIWFSSQFKQCQRVTQISSRLVAPRSSHEHDRSDGPGYIIRNVQEWSVRATARLFVRELSIKLQVSCPGGGNW